MVVLGVNPADVIKSAASSAYGAGAWAVSSVTGGGAGAGAAAGGAAAAPFAAGAAAPSAERLGLLRK